MRPNKPTQQEPVADLRDMPLFDMRAAQMPTG